MRDENGRFVPGVPTPYAWRKGNSANPGGRPRNNGLARDMAREHTQAAIATLAEICIGKAFDARDRNMAAIALLDRGYGKPQITLEVERTPLDELGPEDTKALYQFLTGRTGDAPWLRRAEPETVDLRALPEAARVPRRRA